MEVVKLVNGGLGFIFLDVFVVEWRRDSGRFIGDVLVIFYFLYYRVDL